MNFMLAVVKIGSQQFTVKNEQTLYIPHVEGKAGDKIEFDNVLLVNNAVSYTHLTLPTIYSV